MKRLVLLAVLVTAIVGCVRRIELEPPPDGDVTPDAAEDVPDASDVDASLGLPDAEIDADTSPDAS